MPGNWAASVGSQRSILVVPRNGQGRSHQVVKVKAVKVVWAGEAVGLDTSHRVCIGGVSIVGNVGLKQGVVEGRRRCCRRHRGGARGTDSGDSGRLVMGTVEEYLGVIMGVILAVVVAVAVAVPERVVGVLLGARIVVSQWTTWGRRGPRITGGQCRTQTAVLLFTITGVHAGGGQDNITATINGSVCTSASQAREKRVDGGATDRALDATHVVE